MTFGSHDRKAEAMCLLRSFDQLMKTVRFVLSEAT